MKLFLVILSFAALCYAQSGTVYQPIDITEAQSSTEIQTLIEFSRAAIVKIGIQKGFFSNSDFALTKINNVEEQVNGYNYRFNCSFADSKKVKISANFVVYDNLPKKKRTLVSFSYKVYYPVTNITGNSTKPVKIYETLNISLIENNTQIHNALNFGFTEVIKKGVSQGKIPSSDYNITEKLGLLRLNLTNGVDYLFAVRSTNSAKTVKIFTNFTVYVKHSNGNMTLPAYYYNYTISLQNNTSGNNNTNTTIPIPGTNTTNSTVPTPGNNTTGTNTTGSGSGTETPTNTTTNTTVPTNSSQGNSTDGFVKVDDNEITQSLEIQSVLGYGITQVTQKGIQQGKVPNTGYTVSQISSVARKVGKGKNTYKCSASSVNSSGVRLNMSFTVSYDSKTQATSMSGYSYKVTGIKVPATNTTTSSSSN